MHKARTSLCSQQSSRVSRKTGGWYAILHFQDGCKEPVIWRVRTSQACSRPCPRRGSVFMLLTGSNVVAKCFFQSSYRAGILTSVCPTTVALAFAQSATRASNSRTRPASTSIKAMNSNSAVLDTISHHTGGNCRKMEHMRLRPVRLCNFDAKCLLPKMSQLSSATRQSRNVYFELLGFATEARAEIQLDRDVARSSLEYDCHPPRHE